MNKDRAHFVGRDPGGDGQFGWCVVAGSGLPLSLVQAGCAGDAAAAVRSLPEAPAAWAMVSAAPGWRNIALEELEEEDAFVPVPPVEYWMPVARSANAALHRTSGAAPANAPPDRITHG